MSRQRRYEQRPSLEDVRTDRPDDGDDRERDSEGTDHRQGVVRVDRQQRRRECRARVMPGLDQLQDDVEVGSEQVLADVQPRVVLTGDPRAQRQQDDAEVV